jgi:acyl carrier protein
MSDSVAERIASLVAEALDLARDEVGVDSSMSNTPSWDSMGQINICMAIERQFGNVLDLDTIITATSVRRLAELIDKKSN